MSHIPNNQHMVLHPLHPQLEKSTLKPGVHPRKYITDCPSFLFYTANQPHSYNQRSKNLYSVAQRSAPMALIQPKKLVKMARKSFSRADIAADSNTCSKSIADKGHFVVYTIDGKRFMAPLEYLDSPIFQELFKMSEDVFGLPSNGPITLPCDTVFMDYVISLVQRRISRDVEEAFLLSIAASRCSASSYLSLRQSNRQILLNGL
ncbi:auxin-responsive protein SAUR64-like [Magnolia sinica]|uniref:auxin-responsive protein SAUR64-like n=1 Tax=Magnolia sinica TaxID=86752 RepID=UPI0026584001|nr:auxin-responsive protein SAUR64-like [Magnolia sinica]